MDAIKNQPRSRIKRSKPAAPSARAQREACAAQSATDERGELRIGAELIARGAVRVETQPGKVREAGKPRVTEHPVKVWSGSARPPFENNQRPRPYLMDERTELRVNHTATKRTVQGARATWRGFSGWGVTSAQAARELARIVGRGDVGRGALAIEGGAR